MAVQHLFTSQTLKVHELPPAMTDPRSPTVANPSTPTPPTDPPPLLVVAWTDPVVDALGFDPRSAYVERFWLPLLGPTSTWLLRRLAAEFDTSPEGFSLDARDTARSIGIGNRGGRSGPFHRSIERCVRFGVARHDDHGIVAVRRRVPPLSRTQVRQLSRSLQGHHQRWQEDQLRRSTHPANEHHAARLARSLLDVGAAPPEVEEQLRRWNFDPDAARRALATATSTGAAEPMDAA